MLPNRGREIITVAGKGGTYPLGKALFVETVTAK